jgi:glutaredoxin 3
MSHTVVSLFSGLGMSTEVHELDKHPQGRREMERELARLLGRSPPVPSVFIGSTLIGSSNHIMSLHLAGNSMPLLRVQELCDMWLFESISTSGGRRDEIAVWRSKEDEINGTTNIVKIPC